MNSRFRFVLYSAALLLTLLFALRQNTDPDLGFHLNQGDRILDRRSAPRVEETTYTGEGRPLLDPHWLYQATLSRTRRAGGFESLTLLNAAVLGTVFLLLALRLRASGLPPLFTAVGILLAALAMERRFELRPEVATWAFLSIFLWVLERERRNKTALPVWPLPLLMALWANTQALFVLGLGVLVFALVDDRLRNGRWDRRLSAVGLACLAATLLNPYGLRGALFPLVQWHSLTGGIFGSTIDEFRSPWVLPFTGKPSDALIQFWPYYLLSAAYLAALLGRRIRRLFDVLLGTSFLLLSVIGARNVPLFVLAALPMTLQGAADALPERFRRTSATAAWILVALCLLMGLRIVSGAWYEEGRGVSAFGLGIKPSEFPERTASFMARNGLTGERILNDIPSGNWLQWRCGMKVFVDGRLEALSEEAYRDLLAFRQPGGLARVAERWSAEFLVLDPRTNPDVGAGKVSALPGWRLVSAEECALVYAAPTKADRLPAPDWDGLLAARGIRPVTRLEALGILARKPASGFRYWLEGFAGKRTFDTGLANLAGTAYLTGRPDVAEAITLRMIEASRGTRRELYDNLAGLYRATGRPELAAAAARWAR